MSVIDGLKLRQASAGDVAAIVQLLADDPLGAKRENPGDPAYYRAFAAIDADPNNELWVIEGPDGRVLGVLQLTLFRVFPTPPARVPRSKVCVSLTS